jgi:hypothetical protein
MSYVADAELFRPVFMIRRKNGSGAFCAALIAGGNGCASVPPVTVETAYCREVIKVTIEAVSCWHGEGIAVVYQLFRRLS